MTAPTLQTLLLHVRVALVRTGWPTVLALALFLSGAGAAGMVFTRLQATLEARAADLQQVQARLAAAAQQAGTAPAPLPEAQRNLRQFYDTLGDVRLAEQSLRTMFDKAEEQGLALEQAEYRLSYDRQGRYFLYSVQMPVKGDYPALRGFCEQFLLSLPNASLDDINFKRLDVGASALEARLHFTLYLKGPEDYGAGIAGTINRQGRAP